jgi:predicted nucleic acid-binding protein
MIIDSNIIIYSVKPENNNLRFFLESNFIICSYISVLETLGYHLLQNDEKEFLEYFFQDVYVVRIEDGIMRIAIKLKQQQKMTVADAIIAATALYYNFPLVTNNEEDFKNIKGLQIVNPMK